MTDNQQEQFYASMSMLTTCAEVALENAAEQPRYALAARARLAEFEALTHLAAGKPYFFNQRLQPLTNAINDFMASVEKQINTPIEDEDVLKALGDREEAAAWLDEARIAGCSLLVHLSLAMRPSAKLSLVSNQTNG